MPEYKVYASYIMSLVVTMEADSKDDAIALVARGLASELASETPVWQFEQETPIAFQILED